MQRLMLRSASLTGFGELARSLGLDALPLLRSVGLPPRCLSTPDMRIPAHKCFRLLEQAAHQSACPDFGLRLVRQRGLSHLGALGLMARDQADVRSALRLIVEGLNLHSTCVALQLEEHGQMSSLRISLFPDGEPAVRQATDAGVSGLVKTMAALVGGGWHPTEVHLLDKELLGGLYGKEFGCPVYGGSVMNAVVFPTTDLDRPVAGSDLGFKRFTANLTQDVGPVDGSISVDKVRRIMATLMPEGRCLSSTVAERLGVHRRTLCRHLAAEGEDFSSLLEDLRGTLAQQYLTGFSKRMDEIAVLLGFQTQGSFSRWFHQRFGCSPTHWRGLVGTRG